MYQTTEPIVQVAMHTTPLIGDTRPLTLAVVGVGNAVAPSRRIGIVEVMQQRRGGDLRFGECRSVRVGRGLVGRATVLGPAGLQYDASFAALRQEIELFSHVIFSSNAKTRDFWLGKSPSDDLKSLETKYGGKKPCLHGCDGHAVAKTCKPKENRYCWIKGDPTFESLRQGLLEPEERVWIGEHAPTRHDASQCIAKVATRATPWITNVGIASGARVKTLSGEVRRLRSDPWVGVFAESRRREGRNRNSASMVGHSRLVESSPSRCNASAMARAKVTLARWSRWMVRCMIGSKVVVEKRR